MQFDLFNDNPAPSRERHTRNDIRSGDAAEAFVLAKLLKLGFDAHPARRDAAYDIGAVLAGGRLVRIQVKGRNRSDHGRWSFRFARGNPRTGGGTYPYLPTDYDITAVVAIGLERVHFIAGVCSSIQLTTADFMRAEGEAESWARALSTVNHTRLH